MIKTLAYQPEFRQQLPEVDGNKDYNDFRNLLLRMEEIIESTNLDFSLIKYHINTKISCLKKGKQIKQKQINKWTNEASKALRCSLIIRLKKYPFRVFASQLADSPLLQNFCLINRIDKIKVPSKSTIERYEKMFPVKLINDISNQFIQATQDPQNILNLQDSLSFDDVYTDTTCLEANIHFPVDWVLLRDVVKSLILAIIQVRKKGLKHRMDDPLKFINRMNKLCISMTHARNRKTQKKDRKRILRQMKKLLKKINQHALRHMELLQENWMNTNLSELEKNQILLKFKNVIAQLPEAIHQAHERIIGERFVKNENKILSLYDSDIHVCVRGKAGMSVEFGNTLSLTEQKNGLILDWKLYKDQAPSDQNIMKSRIMEIKKQFKIKSVTADRGMHSKAIKKYLIKEEIKNYVCPKPPNELICRLQEPLFRKHQSRRAQTEGRIGILKHKFLGDPLRSKGFEHREKALAWAVLTHNIWVIARLPEINISKVAA